MTSISIHTLKENELLPRLQKQDAQAFRQFVESYQDQVYNTCLGFLRHPQDAEDITQEVFIEVHKSIAQFREDSKLSTWVYRIAVSKSLDAIRKMKRKKRFAPLQSLMGGTKNEEVGGTDFQHPGIELENQERAQVLFQAIDQLSTNQKVAFTLHKIEGLKHEEIAAVMQTSQASIESLIHRAKKNLQKKLSHYYKENFSRK